jgi:threonine synthase
VTSLLLDLRCPECGRVFDASKVQTFCVPCQRTLTARYDLERAKELLSPAVLAARPADLWRWEELLPLQDPAHRVVLGEPETPILRVRDRDLLPWGELWIKHDGALPTGTFKARGMAMAVSRALELGVGSLFVPTAGNAGAALAAYARRAQLPALVFMPQDAPEAAKEQVQRYGGDLRTVDGHIGDAGRLGREEAARRGAFDVSTLREPYRAEGKKTMGLEIFSALGAAALPDAIVYPTGGGTGILGMHRAFSQLREMGWIARLPRLYAAQAEGCAPVVDALEHGRARVEPVKDPRTAAAGLRVPSPFSSEDLLEAIRSTGGGGVAVPDSEIQHEVHQLALRHGVALAREVGAALAGLSRLRAGGAIVSGERVLVYGTGGWSG